MGDLLRKLYEEAAVYSKDSREANLKLENEVGKLLAPHAAKLAGEERESLEGAFFDACFAGKCTGFSLGMKFCFKLIMELLSD